MIFARKKPVNYIALNIRYLKNIERKFTENFRVSGKHDFW